MIQRVLLALLLASAVGSAFGQEPKIQDNPGFSYACLECSGAYAQMSTKIGEFMQAFFGQQLQPTGAPFGIYFNSPGQVKSESELKWAIGMPVKKGAKVAPPLKLGEFAPTKVAVMVHTGPYDKVGASYDLLFAFVAKSGYEIAGPCLEKWLNNPQQVKPEELRTEIVAPVAAKKK